MIFLRRQLPLLITMVTGLVFAAQYYVPHPASEQLLTSVTKWLQIIGGFALVLGITSLFQLHAAKIRRKEPGWGYSLVLYAGIVVTVGVGLWNGGKETVDGAVTAFGWIYTYHAGSACREPCSRFWPSSSHPPRIAPSAPEAAKRPCCWPPPSSS